MNFESQELDLKKTTSRGRKLYMEIEMNNILIFYLTA